MSEYEETRIQFFDRIAKEGAPKLERASCVEFDPAMLDGDKTGVLAINDLGIVIGWNKSHEREMRSLPPQSQDAGPWSNRAGGGFTLETLRRGFEAWDEQRQWEQWEPVVWDAARRPAPAPVAADEPVNPFRRRILR